MAYTTQEIEYMEKQYEFLGQQIRMLKADQRKLREILRQRKLYEQRIGHKVEDKHKFAGLSPDEKREYNRERQKEYRKRAKEGKTT